MERFRKPSISGRFSKLGYLLKNTVTIVGRDFDIVSPMVRTIVLSVLLVTLFFGALVALVADAIAIGVALLVVWLLLGSNHFFYFNRQEIALSWLVFETAAGRDRCFSEATDVANRLKPQVRWLGILDMAAAWIAWRRNSSGKNGFLTHLLLGAMTESWDLVNHFLLPAFAVDRVGFREGMEKLRAARENVPEALVGVFGIDVVGRVVGEHHAPPSYYSGSLGGWSRNLGEWHHACGVRGW